MSEKSILTLPIDKGTLRDVCWYIIKFGMIPLLAWLPFDGDDEECPCFSIIEDYDTQNARWKNDNDLDKFIQGSPELALYKDHMEADSDYEGEHYYVIKDPDNLLKLLRKIATNNQVKQNIKTHAEKVSDFAKTHGDYDRVIKSIEISNFWIIFKEIVHKFQTTNINIGADAIFKLTSNSSNESYIKLIIQIFEFLVNEYDIMANNMRQESKDDASEIFQFAADNLNKLSAISTNFISSVEQQGDDINTETSRLNFCQVYTSNNKDKFKDYNSKEITLISRDDLKLNLAYPYSLMPLTSKSLEGLFLKKCVPYNKADTHFFSTIQAYLIWAGIVINGQESFYYGTNYEIGLIGQFDEKMLIMFLSAYMSCPQTGARGAQNNMSFIKVSITTIINNGMLEQIDTLISASTKRSKQGGDDIPARVAQPVGKAKWSLNVCLLFAIFLIVCFYIFVEASKNNKVYTNTPQLFTAAEIGARESQP